jgi:hypothetical protein
MSAEKILDRLGEDADDGGLKMLGDIFADEGRLDRAIEMYDGVIKATEEYEDCYQLESEELLGLCYTKYSLGKTLVKRWPALPPVIALRAQLLFDSVLEVYDKRNKKRVEAETRSREAKRQEQEAKKQEQAVSNQQAPQGPGQEPAKSQAEFAPSPPKRANITSREMKEKELVTEDKRDTNQIKDEQRWYRLELNTASEPTLLQLATFDLKGASTTYSRALKWFRSDIGAVEGFEGLWGSRRRQPFEEKEKTDERAADVYQRALKRFDTFFHQTHILIAITSLHLGVNYMLRSISRRRRGI